jgi:dihydropteroate synthase
MIWRCGQRRFDLAERPLVMGIVNVTPDSFSDGGRFLDARAAIAHGLKLADDGADILDIGGESTRPGAEPVSVDEELRRVTPVIEGLAGRTRAAISIDTMKAEVARAALAAGAEIVNDVTALRGDPQMVRAVAESGAGVVLMHMLGESRTMQADPRYEDVVGEIEAFLMEREAWAVERGVARDRIALDPGIGFGKTLEHNLEIFRRMEELAALGRPLAVGPSRKTFLRKLIETETGAAPAPDSAEVERATLAAAVAAVMKGASVVRVHRAAECVIAIRIARRMR